MPQASPQAVYEPPDVRVQLRAYQVRSLRALCWLGTGAGAFLTLANLRYGLPESAALTVLLAVVAFFVGRAADERRPEQMRWLPHVVLAAIVVAAAGAAWVEVPSNSVSLFYLGAVPLTAAHLTNERGSLAWGALCVLVTAGMYGAEAVLLRAGDTASFEMWAVDCVAFLAIVSALSVAGQRRLERHLEEVNRGQRLITDQASALRAAKAEAERSAIELEAANAALVLASETKSRFLANMSHEIRTPMNGVLGMTELLLGSNLDQEQREFVAAVRSSGESLLRVLNDILDLSKLEAGRLDIRPAPTVPRALLRDIERLFAARARAQGLRLDVHVDDDVPEHVLADPDRLRQVLSNLVSNALKFTERGGVRVLLGVPEPSRLRLEVRDTGSGIAPENLACLFEAFHQLDDSASRKTAGTGLGLTICKQIVELMGGTIGVESEVGHGSTFWCEIPAPPVVPQEQSLSGPRGPAAEQALSQLRVLLVEDNPVNRCIGRRFLDRLGIDAELAEDGYEALAAVRARGPFDVILMDCHMPNLDGYEATRALRAEQPAAERPRIVALTASALAEDVERSLAAGMDAHLAKPYTIEDLRDVLTGRAAS